MKEYLKMSDMFKGELSIDCDCDDVIVDELSLTVLESFGGSDLAKYALHAINSHDELVAEVDRLRDDINALSSVRNAAREFFNCTVASGGSVKVASSNKNAIEAANNASDWLEVELGNTIRFNKGA